MTDTTPDFFTSMTLEEMDDWLKQYGVKGMKWGVRKEHVTAVANKVGEHRVLIAGSTTPVAILMGLGPPASVALGLGIFAVQQPPISTGIVKGAEFTAQVAQQAGEMTVSAMQNASSAVLSAIPGVGGESNND